MCFGELVERLRQADVTATEMQIRWAIKTGKVSRPRMDRSLRFDFSDENTAEIIRHFRSRESATV